MALALFFGAPVSAHAALNIPITVHLSEAVNVTGTPRIVVDVGGTPRYATYTSGTGTNALTFTLSPQAGDVDLDGVTVSSPIDLNGGTITDTKGNPLSSLTFTPPNTTNVKVNYPSLGMDFVYDADGRYTLNGTAYNDLSSFLTAAGGTFTRASIGTYFDSAGVMQTAASGTPRFDYDPVTHAAKGILIEEARTNLLTYSAMSSLTGWSASSLSLLTVNNPGSLPVGATSCLRDEVASGQTNGYTIKNVTLTSGATYTYSAWVYVPSSVPATKAKLSAWYVNTGVWYGITSTVITERDQWVRKTLTFTANATYAAHVIGIGVASASPGDYTYGCLSQLEQGSFPTSYIPTTSTTVTRQADDLVIPTGSWLNGNTGTLFGEALAYNATASAMNSASPTIATINTSGGAISRVGRYIGNTGLFQSQTAGVNLLSLGAWNNGTSQKIAGSYDANGFSAILGTNTLNTNGPGSLSGTLQQLRIGQYNASGYWSSTIARIKYYPARVADTQLQLLTQ